MTGASQVHQTLEADREVADDDRRTFVLDETGFKEVPKRWRRFYRHWQGEGDSLGPNEVICPVCKVVIRSLEEIASQT